jgi:SIR2-like protein
MTNLSLFELQDRYRAGQLIPFIGAGVSMSVAWNQDGHRKRGPSWKELVDEAARKLGFDPELLRVRGTDLQILEYFRLKNNNEFASLTNWLFAEMRPPDDALRASTIHQRLAELRCCRLFYTTNYDNFIERSFELHGRPCRRVAVEAHMADSSTSTDLCEVVKFHGDLDFPGHMVLSESHYEQRLTLSTAMDYRLRSDLLGRVLLFIGYSFRDWNVSYLFRLFNEQFRQLPGSPTGRRAYITVPDPSDFEIQLFRARNIEVIPVTGRDQAHDIATLLEEIRR